MIRFFFFLAECAFWLLYYMVVLAVHLAKSMVSIVIFVVEAITEFKSPGHRD